MEEDSGKLPVGAGGAVDMAVAHASKKSQKIKGKQPWAAIAHDLALNFLV